MPAYLSELGFGPFQIGIVASAALLGTAAVTLATGFVAPSRDLRNLLLLGAFATVATGLAFQATEQFVLILVIAFVGTMNPSSRDSPHYRIDLHQSTNLPRERPHRKRRRVTKPTDNRSPRTGHDLCAFQMQRPTRSNV